MIQDTRVTPHDFGARKTQAKRRRRGSQAQPTQDAQATRAVPVAEDDPFAADHTTDIGKFFAGPTDSVAESHALWAELDAHALRAPRRKLHRGMIWTVAIALLGLLLNGAFLLYHKVWMPAPVELDASPPRLLLPGTNQAPSAAPVP